MQVYKNLLKRRFEAVRSGLALFDILTLEYGDKPEQEVLLGFRLSC